jgi:hypothetical protein
MPFAPHSKASLGSYDQISGFAVDCYVPWGEKTVGANLLAVRWNEAVRG